MAHTPSLPELLAPAGSPEALEAALLAGADAVYLGGSRLNARMNAHNFDAGELREAVTHAHACGGRVYLTLNTLVWDRELTDALDAAYEAASYGVDALIIADLGAADLIRRALPGLPLHASTQLSGHNARMGEVLAPLGFSRFVIARETSLDDLAAAVKNNPLEVEVFIHGALCVSHSGQCLFSSVVGGRSGNRGECAQPCRLPYGCSSAAGKEKRGSREDAYPLSLKDLSLAGHVPALIEAGVSSLKIEGRMKSPGYVGGVVTVWRRLLDERRAATSDEMVALGNLFSRGGFTDGYQTGYVDHRMMGVRSEVDKEKTAAAERAALAQKHPPRLPVEMVFFAAPEEPVRLTATAPLYRQGGIDHHMGAPVGGAPASATVTVTVTGDTPTAAEASAVLTMATVEKQLSRTGGTPYIVTGLGGCIRTNADGRAPSLPLSRLNALRRAALEALDAARMSAIQGMDAIQGMADPTIGKTDLSAKESFRQTFPAESTLDGSAQDAARRSAGRSARRSARFRSAEQITDGAIGYFDRLYLPLGRVFPARVPFEKRGYILPPVIFDREAGAVLRALTDATADGVRHLLVGNLGHLPLLSKAVATAQIPADAVAVHGDFRFNAANSLAVARLRELGISDLLLSPELTLPRMRDIAKCGFVGAIVYGRLPLMLLEKCAIREIYRDTQGADGCASVCRSICSRDAAVLTDRMGKTFPVLREDAPGGRGHRNTVCNSLPLSMSDRPDELARAGLAEHHYLFTVESPREVDRVMAAYREGLPLGGEVRRMVK